MGIDGRAEDGGHDEADNVIRFPRDWFGSKDDLIPIGPAADRLEAATAAASAEREQTSALSADDFWGESSGALHQAVDVPDPGEVDFSPRELVDDERPPAARWGSARGVSRMRSTWIPRPAVPRSALVLAALLAGALALFLVGGLGTRTGHTHVTVSASARAVRPTQTVPLQFDREKLSSVGHAALRLASDSHVVKSSRAQPVRRRIQKPHRSTAPGRRAVESVARTDVTSSTSSTPAAGSTPPSTPTTEPTSAQSSSPQSDQASSSSTSSGSSSAAVAAGPTSPGTSGLNCSPQCR